MTSAHTAVPVRAGEAAVDWSLRRRWLVLPIESTVRELDARVLVAAVAAERGLGVVLARQPDLSRVLPHLPAAVVLQMNVIGTGVLDAARAAGHVATALDEEGLVQRDPADYLLRRVSPDALGRCARFFAWGQAHKEVLAQHVPEAAERIVATGSPRFDLLRPGLRGVYRAAADDLQRQYGPYVLVNTNFGAINHRLGRAHVEDLWQRNGWSNGPERQNLLARLAAFQAAMFDEFVAAVRALAGDLRDRAVIVVRPHPAEDHETYRARLGDVPGVAVVREGPVVPWLLGAAAVIHNGCTTGIEAAVLGRPVFAFTPVRDEPVEASLPNDVTPSYDTQAALVTAVRAAVESDSHDPVSPAMLALLDRHVSGLDGRLAAEVLVDHVEQIAPSGSPVGSAVSLTRRITGGRAEVAARSWVSSLLYRQVAAQRRYRAFVRHTSTRLDPTQVQCLVDGLHAATGRFGQVAVRRLAPDVLAIAGAE